MQTPVSELPAELLPEGLAAARARVAPHVLFTPLVPADAGNWLKLETLQPTGSFKVRPAFNGMLARLGDCRARGVVASSSGNFAQAVAFAARALGVDATIVMPSNTSPYKIARTRLFGGTVALSGPSFEERWALTEKLQRETGRVLLHPYDSPDTIAADAAIGSELLEQLAGPFTVVVPCSGGGMLAGIALAVKNARPQARVIGVQPAANGAMRRSLAEGHRIKVSAPVTIADALVASMPGELTFALARRFVDEVITVDEAELGRAVSWLARERKLVAEPGGAAAVAALLAGRIGGSPVVCVVSGGNVDARTLSGLLTD